LIGVGLAVDIGWWHLPSALIMSTVLVLAVTGVIHAAVSLSIAQSGTYVFLVAIGYQRGAAAPLLSPGTALSMPVVDPVVQAMALTDIVVSTTVTALLLALTVLIEKTYRTVDPDELQRLRG
jgi:multicomponent Na+:H+ antiporter subunit C